MAAKKKAKAPEEGSIVGVETPPLDWPITAELTAAHAAMMASPVKGARNRTLDYIREQIVAAIDLAATDRRLLLEVSAFAKAIARDAVFKMNGNPASPESMESARVATVLRNEAMTERSLRQGVERERDRLAEANRKQAAELDALRPPKEGSK